MNFREGTSKAGKPYAGNFCSNKECDYVEWQEAKPQADKHDEIMNGIRMNWKKIDELEKKMDAWEKVYSAEEDMIEKTKDDENNPFNKERE